MTILIVPATSRTNTFVINALLSSHTTPTPSLRLFAHSADAKARLQDIYKDKDNVSVITGDLYDAGALREAMDGVSAVFYNAPVLEGEVQMGKNVVDAARNAHVAKFIYCSLMHPYIKRLIHHRVKLKVEEYLFESDLNYTILQPTHLMQNIDVRAAVATGKLPLPYSPTITHGFLDLVDLGEVATSVLLAPLDVHAYSRYELVGVNATYLDVARLISVASGDNIRIESVDKDAVLQKLLESKKIRDEYGRDALKRMMVYYDERGLPGNANILRWLLGREPTSLRGYIERELRSSAE